MRKLLSFTLASLMLMSAVACAKNEPVKTSSSASAAETFLVERLGAVPEEVILGDASVAASYGVDMSDFENDGYILRTVGDETLVFGKTEDGLDRAVRKYAKAVQNGTDDTLDETYHEGYRIERLTIAGRDISEYTVYYPETANENMKFAADEFVRLVKKACGTELPIVVGEPESPAIEFRHTDDPALETDGYRYFVNEDELVIEGAVKRGCMNGVWRFLQLECGWDFLIYGDSHLQESDHVDIPVGTQRTEEPSFEYLNLWNRYDNFVNDRTLPTDAQNSYGTVGSASHGIFNFYVSDHYGDGDQPCYTDEDFYEETLENVRAYVEKNYYTDPSFNRVNIGQNDSTTYCQCATCLEVLAEEGGNAGAVVRHANFLAEEINKDYPGVAFTIFAYAGSNTPPKKTRVNENVYVTFCYDWNCSNHKFDGSDCKDTVYFYDRSNKHYAEWVEGWCDKCENVYVYPYNLGTGLNEYTVINNVYDDYRYLHEIGVKGVCLEGSDYGNFGLKRIEQTLISEINWNYGMTRDEFTELYHKLLRYEYGEGWEYVLEYIDQWELSQDMVQCWSWWGISPGDQTSRWYDTGFYGERFDSFVELLDTAALDAESAIQEERVKRLSCSVLYKGCYSSYFLAWKDGDEAEIERLSALYDRCMNTLYELGENPEDLIKWWDGNRIHYRLDLEEEAWSRWAEHYYVITGEPLPDDAPVIEKE